MNFGSRASLISYLEHSAGDFAQFVEDLSFQTLRVFAKMERNLLMEAALLRRIPYHWLLCGSKALLHGHMLQCVPLPASHIARYWDVLPRTVASERWNCRNPQRHGQGVK